MQIRRSDERGAFDHGWLRTRHTFSFGEYHDPEFTRFRSLRVINEDWVGAGQGFDPHPHRDMEIVTYVLSGALQHRDSMGNGSVIRAGEFQKMSAGSGITHSEFNASKTEDVHLLQIWVTPAERGIAPNYHQIARPPADRRGKLVRVAAPVAVARAGEEIPLFQDASLWVGAMDEGQEVGAAVAPGRHAWLHVATGEVRLGELTLRAGDAVSLSGPAEWSARALAPGTEVLVFDLN